MRLNNYLQGIIGSALSISGRPIGTGRHENRDAGAVHAPPLPRPNYEAGLTCILNFDGRVDFVPRRW